MASIDNGVSDMFFFDSQFSSFLFQENNPMNSVLDASTLWDRVAYRYFKPPPAGGKMPKVTKYSDVHMATERIFIPVSLLADSTKITSGIHWVLVTIDIKAKHLLYLDSKKVNNNYVFPHSCTCSSYNINFATVFLLQKCPYWRQVLDNCANFMSVLYEKKFHGSILDTTRWERLAPDVPQQKNDVDCGVYTML
jgi:hypothetical protein